MWVWVQLLSTLLLRVWVASTAFVQRVSAAGESERVTVQSCTDVCCCAWIISLYCNKALACNPFGSSKLNRQAVQGFDPVYELPDGLQPSIANTAVQSPVLTARPCTLACTDTTPADLSAVLLLVCFLATLTPSCLHECVVE